MLIAGRSALAVEIWVVNECNRLWLLKKSCLRKIGEILEIENVYQNKDRRL
jgi:hypothetical protein